MKCCIKKLVGSVQSGKHIDGLLSTDSVQLQHLRGSSILRSFGSSKEDGNVNIQCEFYKFFNVANIFKIQFFNTSLAEHSFLGM